MESTPAHFKTWHNPDPSEIGADYVEFLEILGKPAWITISGEDTNRSRAIVTLLHGNEPSGLKAVHRMIASGVRPATNLGIFIGSVKAALHRPCFSHRFLPEEQDLNRCFNPPWHSDQSKLAASILETLEAFAPEAVVDAHNTSAHSEIFAVSIAENTRVRQITQVFTRRLVVIDQDLGALIEHSSDACPIVTVEFGGLMDPRAHALAEETLRTFVTMRQLFEADPLSLQVLRHPLRLQVKPGFHVHYSSSVQDDAEITLFNTIDQLNFSSVGAGTALGWLGSSSLDALEVKTATGYDAADEFFAEDNGFLVTTQPITIFMATTDSYIAQKDCLFYMAPADHD